MAQVLLACRRDRGETPSDAALQRLAARLNPDNAAPATLQVARDAGLVTAVVKPAGTLVEGLSAAVGIVLGPPADWPRPGAPAPDGQHAIFRADADRVELVTDILGARSIWYYHDDRQFLASTSQRALVMLLGSYEPEPRTTAWHLATGTLGPDLSWDARLRLLPADSRLLLDRAAWQVTVTTRPDEFRAEPGSEADHLERLRGAFDAAFDGWSSDPANWAVSLSGGYDSRYILRRLAERGVRPLCLSYGLAERRELPGGDCDIAARLAAHHGAPFQFCPVDPLDDVPLLLDRFVRVSEARMDHLQHFADGFARLAALEARGIAGVIRGEQAAGLTQPLPANADGRPALDRAGLVMLDDYADARDLGCGSGRFPRQELPERFARRPDESPAGYRDRLYQAFRLPFFLGPQAYAHTAYGEVVMPLLSRGVIEAVRGLPDALRLGKSLFIRIADEGGAPVPQATAETYASPEATVRSAGIVAEMRRRLAADDVAELVGTGPVEYLLEHLQTAGLSDAPSPRRRLRSRLKRLVKQYGGTALVELLRGRARRDVNIVAFRLYLIAAMRELLRADAEALAE